MEFFTYVLKSVEHKIHYIGHSSDLNQRLKYHNSGKVKFTKSYGPWKLIYSEKFKNRSEAIIREKYLKSGIGREWLAENISDY